MDSAETSMPVDPKKEKKAYGKYDKWEVESWARTITEAEEIKANPEKMKYVKMCLGKQMSAMKKAVGSLDDLRALAKGESDEEESEEYT